ncbi:unnamed protein product [Dovyalis caffra]|uniref:Uncharacterized protein n=1 Tax=Dovyalis caffra TaxID=77055 RepID=A0AAV1SHT8_9ROSI|nr:unnamed protein product [Dovyalis caffra]
MSSGPKGKQFVHRDCQPQDLSLHIKLHQFESSIANFICPLNHYSADSFLQTKSIKWQLLTFTTYSTRKTPSESIRTVDSGKFVKNITAIFDFQNMARQYKMKAGGQKEDS